MFTSEVVNKLIDHLIETRNAYLNPVLYGMEEGFRDVVVCQIDIDSNPVQPNDILIQAFQSKRSGFRRIHFLVPVSCSVSHYETTFPLIISNNIATRPPGILNPNPPLFIMSPNPLPSLLHDQLLQNGVPAVLLNHPDKPSTCRTHLACTTTQGAVSLGPIRAPVSDGSLASPPPSSGRQYRTLLLDPRFREYVTRWLFTRCARVRRLRGGEKSARQHEFDGEMLRHARRGASDSELYRITYNLLWGREQPKPRAPVFAPNSPHRVRERCDDILSILPKQFKPGSILDIGCADGKILEMLGQRMHLDASCLHGVDVRPPSVSSRITFHEVSAEDPSAFESGQFDLIVIAMTLHHIRFWKTALQNCRRWLSPDGVIVVREHDANSELKKCMLDVHDGLFTLSLYEYPEQRWMDWAATAHSFFLSRDELQIEADRCGLSTLAWSEDISSKHVNADGPIKELTVRADKRDDWEVHGMVYYIAFGVQRQQGDESEPMTAVCRNLVTARDHICSPLSYTHPVSRTALVVERDGALAPSWRRSLVAAGLPGSDVITEVDQLSGMLASYNNTQVPVIVPDYSPGIFSELLTSGNIPLICTRTGNRDAINACASSDGWQVEPQFSDTLWTTISKPAPEFQFPTSPPAGEAASASGGRRELAKISSNFQFHQLMELQKHPRESKNLVPGFWKYLSGMLGRNAAQAVREARKMALTAPDHEIYLRMADIMHGEATETEPAAGDKENELADTVTLSDLISGKKPGLQLTPVTTPASRSKASTSRESRWVSDCSRMLRAAGVQSERVRVVVDLGCGDGAITAALRSYFRLPKGSVVGLDVREPADHSSFTWARCNVEKHLPLPSNSVDLVVMSMMIHHIAVDARRRLLSEVSRILSPRGVLVVRDNDAELMVHSLMLDIQHGIYACVNTRPPEMSVAAFVSEFRTAYLSLAQLQRDARACGLHSIHVSDIRSDQFRKYWMVLGKQHAGDRIRDRDRRGRGGDRRGRGRDLGSMRPHIPPRDGAPMGLDQWSAARHRGRRKRLR